MDSVDCHTWMHICDWKDVVSYYQAEVLQEDHTTILLLYISYQLLDEEHNNEFCQVFHPAN